MREQLSKNERDVEERQLQRILSEVKEEEKRDIMKKEQYKNICRAQITENERLKEIQRKKEAEAANAPVRGEDLLGKLFEEKKHISYDKMKKQEVIIDRVKD